MNRRAAGPHKRQNMKKQMLLWMALLAIGLSACHNRRSADVEELFRSVPATTSFVAVADLESMVDKIGGEVKDGKVEMSDKLRRQLSGVSSGKFIRMLDGESGIDPAVAVLFSDGVSTYLTGYISNTEKFRAFAGDSAHWSESEGVNISGPAAYKDNRFWMLVSGRKVADAETINEYLALSESQSFAGKKDFASRFTEMKNDLQGWGDIDGMMNLINIGFQERAMARMAVETLYSDGGFLWFTADFKKGEFTADACVLNRKGKPARFNIPSGTIDVSAVGKLTGSASMLMAVDVPAKLVEQLRSKTQGAPSVLGIVLGTLGSVDGTVAVASGPQGTNGVISTNGGSTADLQSLLGEVGMKCSIDGKYLIFGEQKNMGGGAQKSVAELASHLSKKSCASLVAVSDGSKPSQAWMDFGVLSLESHSGTMMLKVRLVARDSGSNVLLSMLK